ncbi:MAG: glycoside hydrolase family 13 [Gemmatimonadetes bacterium]|uniref:Glycoside hydrolase family 13 n=1 Tax=Candidatus Kutchimonas denitrificans TaxID=3056748 RepID=A0AAE4ZCX7_9BACT|nr:glycoside hydrolase family 13 [Gemmatimonadota bacterium]NIR75625.1 glycoside hydrolase family 13 [Candidatus Kutchimonas denitrificans]NIS02926.1 glycoside hydrolase family 13 [Gemmatimonadota bacterium]NIT68648.1 glycoside hydrolase family 13 [Gemmatimonadota bacterium]NIV25327.1 glycoside hydrolase family 13 [Gemmatimonadota bacterium]
MRKELQDYLDGELSWSELPAELRGEAEAWERLFADLRAGAPAGAPAELEERVEAALADRRRGGSLRRAADWTLRPRSVRVNPLAGLAAAAVLALLIVRPWSEGPTPEPGVATVYVEFALDAPGARTVAVAGDFNNWSPPITLSDLDGDGVWTGRVAVQPGLHQYMFLIDGSDWRTDPKAERYADDGFGNRNAVMVVAAPPAKS